MSVRIGLVGGVERNETDYREIAERAGHTLAFHSGHIGGRGSTTLAGLVRSVDLLIVVTDVNSHGAVQLARREARKAGVPVVLYRRCSPARLAAVVAGLDSWSAPQWAAAGGLST
jgi:hypothetical protein